MNEDIQQILPGRPFARAVYESLRKDLVWIIIAAAGMAAAAAVLGKLTGKATSTAQLALTPVPLQRETETGERVTEPKDALARLLARPLDVSTVSLLCKSDAVLQETLDTLNADGELSAPIKYITTLSNALSHRVTVAKETPYEVVYTPVVELKAEARVPKDACVMVNTWAEVVQQTVTRFKDAVQKPLVVALDARVEALAKELTEAEQASERFWTENNIEYCQSRLNEVVGLINSFKKSRTEIETELIGERASLDAFTLEEASEQPKISLNWKPSEGALAALGAKLGLGAPAQDGGLDSFIEIEHLNSVYWEIHGKVAATRPGIAAKEAQLKELLRLTEELEKERLGLQEVLARIMTEKARVGRRLERVEAAYQDIALKNEFARVAGMLEHPVVQVIARGTEWPLPRFRRALTFGGVAGVLAFGAAVLVSAGCRTLFSAAVKG